MRLSRRLFLPVLLPLVSAPLVPAQSSLRPPEPPEGLVFETLSGTSRRIPLEGLDLADPRERGAWSVRVEGFQSPPPSPAEAASRRVQVRLHGGEELRGRIVGGQGEVLSVELLGGVRLPLEVERIQRILLPEQLAPLQLVPLEAPREGDRLYRRTQAALDAIDGTLDSFSDQGVSFESDEVGRKAFPWEEVAALFVEFLGDDNAVAPTPAVPVVVDLADGGRLHAGLLEIREEEMDLVTRAGRGLRLKRSAVAELFVPGAGARYLSELTPTVVGPEGSPFGDGFGMVWPHRVDRSVTGGPLRCGGRLYTRGIGVHAPSKLQWELDGSWSTLKLAVGVDDEALELGGQGSVVFRVLVDGEARFESELITVGQKPVVVPPVSLEGAKLLSLEVEMASDLHVGDRADWLRPVLVR